MTPHQTLLTVWASRYVKAGWSLIPVRTKSKEPLIIWQEFQQRKARLEEVTSWINKWPDMNLGIVTGKVSQLVVVDLDGLKGQIYGKQQRLVSTITAVTGKGKQVFYKWTEPVNNSASKIAPGVDIRGDGGYVVVAPSIHPNGRRYRWERFVPSALETFPMSVRIPTVPSSECTQVGNESGWIAKALGDMKHGNIDDTLFKVCSRLRNDGYTEEDARILLQPHAKKVGASPSHLDDKIRNVWGRYQPRPVTERAMPSQTSGSLVLHSPTNPDSLDEFSKRQLDMAHNEHLQTGYQKFDALSKGLKKGEVLTVAARTGVGKTNWIITPIRTFCEAGNKVLLFSTEMSFDQIWQRYTTTLADSSTFKQHALFICDEFTPNIERIEEAIRNVQPDLFVFDHISHIGTDYHIISKFMSEIKRLARLYGIPAIVTAQLNRNADYVEAGARIEPRLSMIQGSDQIGQMSAQVLLLNEKRINGDVTEIEGIVVKNRHGDKGLIQFGLLKNPYRIEEI